MQKRTKQKKQTKRSAAFLCCVQHLDRVNSLPPKNSFDAQKKTNERELISAIRASFGSDRQKSSSVDKAFCERAQQNRFMRGNRSQCRIFKRCLVKCLVIFAAISMLPFALIYLISTDQINRIKNYDVSI